MKTREQWLRDRKNYLTASDCAAVLGVPTAFNTALDVWRDKTTDAIESYDNKLLKYGRFMEPFTAELYEDETGRPVRDPGATAMAVHPSIPWLAATLDRETLLLGDWYPLELKQVLNPMHYPEEWAANPPGHYWVQCQIQASCKAVSWCFLTGMFTRGGEPELANVDIDFDSEFFEMALPELERFWEYNVQQRIPPEVTDHPKSLAAVKRAFSGRSRLTVILSEDDAAMADSMQEKRDEANELKRDADQIEAQLRGQLGESRFGSLNDGTIIELAEVKRKAYSVAETTYFQIRRKRI